MNLSTGGTRLAMLGVASALLVLAAYDAEANHITDSSSAWLIDADPTGNTATTLGPREACVTATPDSDVTVDITILDVPAVDTKGTSGPEDDTGGFLGYHIELTYDSSALSVQTVNSDMLLGDAPGSNIFTVADPLPDSDGSFVDDSFDLGFGPGSTESGSGVIDRITLHVEPGAADGPYVLNLVQPAHIDSQSQSASAPIVYSAQIAVGVPCPGPDIVGDIDCSGGVSSVDALKVLRYGAALSVAQTEPCNDPGSQSPPIGDVDCSGTTNAVDALKVLRFGAALSYVKVHLCDDIGS